MDAITCPNCWQLNPADAGECRRCRHNLAGVAVDQSKVAANAAAVEAAEREEPVANWVPDWKPVVALVGKPASKPVTPIPERKSQTRKLISIVSFVLLIVYPIAGKLLPSDSRKAMEENDRGVALQEQGKLDQAIARYDEAINLDPDLAPAYHNRGRAYGLLGEYDLAMADVEQAIELDPEFGEAYLLRGSAHLSLGNFAQAVTDYDRAIDLLDGSGKRDKLKKAYLVRGLARASAGDLEEGIADLDQAIALDQKFAIAYFWRGTFRAEVGRAESAINDLWLATQLGLEPELDELAEAMLEEIR